MNVKEAPLDKTSWKAWF